MVSSDFLPYRSGFLNLNTNDILCSILVLGTWPVNCRVFGIILGQYPLDASSNLLSCDKQKNAPGYYQMSPGELGAKSPPVENCNFRLIL